MYKLGEEARVSPRTIFKVEVDRNPRLRHRTLDNIAGALGVHPNRLFVLANLTPFLRSFDVTDEECLLLEVYLIFLKNSEFRHRAERTSN